MAVTSSMTVAQARTLAQAYLDAPGATDISTAQWLLFANRAQFEVFRKVADVNPDHFTQQQTFTYTGGYTAMSLNNALATNSDVYRVLGVEAYSTTTPTTGVDFPVRLKPIRFADLSAYQRGAAPNFDESYDATVPAYYAVVGTTTSLTLNLAPVPTQNTLLLVTYTATPDALTGDSSAIGVPLEYQDAVARRMASLANIRTGGRNQAIEQAWRDALADIEATAGPKVDDEPRQMHVFGDGW